VSRKLGNSVRLNYQSGLQLLKTYMMSRTYSAWESINLENVISGEPRSVRKEAA
jgi:hypothetical protein